MLFTRLQDLFLAINLSKAYLDLSLRITFFEINKFTKRTHSHFGRSSESLDESTLDKSGGQLVR